MQTLNKEDKNAKDSYYLKSLAKYISYALTRL
jgi:hypothetical protein